MFNNNSYNSKFENLMIRSFNLIAEALREEPNDSSPIVFNDDLDHHIKYLQLRIFPILDPDQDQIDDALMQSDLHKGIEFYSGNLRVDMGRYSKRRQGEVLIFKENSNGYIRTIEFDNK